LLKNRLAPATGQAKSRIGATLERSEKKNGMQNAATRDALLTIVV